MQMGRDISVVLPTYNRAPALRENLPSILALDGVFEVIVVDDGSTDATASLLQTWGDSRLRLVHQEVNRGSPAARNLGAAIARAGWVLFGEDDCRFPRDYAVVLREEAEAHQADIAGAPMVHAPDQADLGREVAAARARNEGPKALDAVAGFPSRAIATPLLPAPAIVRRPVFERVRFDERYRGNAYREETDFFVRAARSGFKCLLTPRTFFWERRRWEGGNERGLLEREYWTVRNNWRFLRRQGRWLVEEGYIASPAREQLAFVVRRLIKAARKRAVGDARGRRHCASLGEP